MPLVHRDPRRLAVLGMGTALPGPPVATDDLIDRIEANFDVDLRRRARALGRRLGIRTRHLARDFTARVEAPRPDDTNPDLAARAVTAALDAARLTVSDLAFLIGHTATPHWPLPSNVALVAERLGYRGPYLELRQACAGFAHAAMIAQGLCAGPGAGPVAIVGSETGSVFFDPGRADGAPGQLVNLLQMGDGAGAIVLAPDHDGARERLGGLFLGQLGWSSRPGLKLATGGSAQPFADGHVHAFEHDYQAVKEMGARLFAAGAEAAGSLGGGPATADLVVPHQANGRLAGPLGRALGIAPERVFIQADRVGNTGSAAIWLALAEARGRLDPGGSALVLGAEATKHLFGGFRLERAAS